MADAERRDTGSVQAQTTSPVNGVLTRWMLGLVAAAVIGAVGWMAAWGEQGADVAHLKKGLTAVERQQDQATKQTAALIARQEMMLQTLGVMQRDIKTLLGRGRRHR